MADAEKGKIAIVAKPGRQRKRAVPKQKIEPTKPKLEEKKVPILEIERQFVPITKIEHEKNK